MGVQVVQLIIDNWGKIATLVGTFSGALAYLATSLWKLSRAVTRFEMTQQQMLINQREDRANIERLQMAVAKIVGTLRLRVGDSKEEII